MVSLKKLLIGFCFPFSFSKGTLRGSDSSVDLRISPASEDGADFLSGGWGNTINERLIGPTPIKDVIKGAECKFFQDCGDDQYCEMPLEKCVTRIAEFHKCDKVELSNEQCKEGLRCIINTCISSDRYECATDAAKSYLGEQIKPLIKPFYDSLNEDEDEDEESKPKLLEKMVRDQGVIVEALKLAADHFKCLNEKSPDLTTKKSYVTYGINGDAAIGIGGAAAAGVMIGVEHGKIKDNELGAYFTRCRTVGVDLGSDIGYEVGESYMEDYKDFAGKSTCESAEASYVYGAGLTVCSSGDTAPLNTQWALSTSAGFGGGFSAASCQTWTIFLNTD